MERRDKTELTTTIDPKHLRGDVPDLSHLKSSFPPIEIDPNKDLEAYLAAMRGPHSASISVEYVTTDEAETLRALLNTRIGDADTYSALITPLNAEFADADRFSDQLAGVLAAAEADVTGDRRALQNGGAATLFGATTTADADDAVASADEVTAPGNGS